MSELTITKLELLLVKNQTDADGVAEMLEEALEEYAMDDGFGTERQLDPRGDGRDEDFFSMYDVRDLDDEDQATKNKHVIEKIKSLFQDDEYLAEHMDTFLDDYLGE